MESSELIGEVKNDTSLYKNRVMAVLANAPLNMLTNKEMLWAASNLPDTRTKGMFETKMNFAEVNHEAESLYKAYDISEEELKSFAQTMKESISYMTKFPKEEQTNSRSVTYIAEKLGNNPKFVLSLIIKVMGDAASIAGSSDIRAGIIRGSELKDILRKLMGGMGKKDSDGLDNIDF